jgi:hypothetical protein
VVAVLHEEADPDPGQRHERKGELRSRISPLTGITRLVSAG